jgi:hypothetical protein
MSAIEIAMHKTASPAKPVAGATSVSSWIAEHAIKLSELIAGGEPSAENRAELPGNPWARPIGLGNRR